MLRKSRELAALLGKSSGSAALTLVVSDDVPMTRDVESILQAQGDRTIVARTAQFALHLLEEERMRPIILDLTSTKLDGYKLFEEMKTRFGVTGDDVIAIATLPTHSDFLREDTDLLTMDPEEMRSWEAKEAEEMRLRKASIANSLSKPFTPDQLIFSLKMWWQDMMGREHGITVHI